MEVTNRATLWSNLHAASGGDAEKVKACIVSYAPPAERLIIRSTDDFAAIGTSKEAVHGACDTSFWAYGDFESVYNSFALDKSDKERRVMGIEGVGPLPTQSSSTCCCMVSSRNGTRMHAATR